MQFLLLFLFDPALLDGLLSSSLFLCFLDIFLQHWNPSISHHSTFLDANIFFALSFLKERIKLLNTDCFTKYFGILVTLNFLYSRYVSHNCVIVYILCILEHFSFLDLLFDLCHLQHLRHGLLSQSLAFLSVFFWEKSDVLPSRWVIVDVSDLRFA